MQRKANGRLAAQRVDARYNIHDTEYMGAEANGKSDCSKQSTGFAKKYADRESYSRGGSTCTRNLIIYQITQSDALSCVYQRCTIADIHGFE